MWSPEVHLLIDSIRSARFPLWTQRWSWLYQKRVKEWFILSTTKILYPLGSLKIRDAFFFFFLVSMRYYPGGQEEKRRVQMRKRGGNGSKTSYCAWLCLMPEPWALSRPHGCLATKDNRVIRTIIHTYTFMQSYIHKYATYKNVYINNIPIYIHTYIYIHIKMHIYQLKIHSELPQIRHFTGVPLKN